jgi:glutamyl-Q tRNA(Asp) synthetase
VRRQSEHLADYAQALDKLRDRNLIYPCFCTRGDILRAIAGRPDWPRDPDGAPLYPRTCRHLHAAERDARLASSERAAWRLDMQKVVGAVDRLIWAEYDTGDVAQEVPAEPQAWGDVVLARRDIATSYHISVVVDDARQGVTDIVRGKDLFAATSVHRLLQALLGLAPPRYHHHDLITDASGHKLSKSRGSPSLRDLRASGMTPEEIRKAVGFSSPKPLAAAPGLPSRSAPSPSSFRSDRVRARTRPASCRRTRACARASPASDRRNGR